MSTYSKSVRFFTMLLISSPVKIPISSIFVSVLAIRSMMNLTRSAMVARHFALLAEQQKEDLRQQAQVERAVRRGRSILTKVNDVRSSWSTHVRCAIYLSSSFFLLVLSKIPFIIAYICTIPLLTILVICSIWDIFNGNSKKKKDDEIFERIFRCDGSLDWICDSRGRDSALRTTLLPPHLINPPTKTTWCFWAQVPGVIR